MMRNFSVFVVLFLVFGATIGNETQTFVGHIGDENESLSERSKKIFVSDHNNQNGM